MWQVGNVSLEACNDILEKIKEQRKGDLELLLKIKKSI